MTLKNLMLGSAVAALIAGGAVAQDTNTDTTAPQVPAVEGSAELDAQATTGADTQMGTDTEMSADTDVQTETDSEMAAEEPVAPEAETDMAAEEPMAPDAGETMAPETEVAEAPMTLDEMTVEEVIGTSVIGIDNETVGEIDYVVADGTDLSFVIGIGGFLGLGEYTVAIPADQFEVDSEGVLKLSSLTRAELEQQPEFDESTAESLPGDVVIGSLS